jgi:hypothetical protein
LVALYFSVRDSGHEDDGMLYAYHHGVPEVDIESPSDPFSITQIELIRPPHLDQRVIAQQSVFTAEPPFLKEGDGRENAHVKYWYVSTNCKDRIRDELARLGISDSSLFPGMASLAAEIKHDASLRKDLTAGKIEHSEPPPSGPTEGINGTAHSESEQHGSLPPIE